MWILKYTEHASLDKDGKEGDFFDGSLQMFQISGMYFLLVSSPFLSFLHFSSHLDSGMKSKEDAKSVPLASWKWLDLET